jgi:hypothetical protein
MREKIKVQIANDPGLKLLEFSAVDFDDQRFHPRGNENSLIKWGDMVRIARGYRIHPFVAIDWDFLAFQTQDLSLTVWVYDQFNTAFIREIARRFCPIDAEPMSRWTASEFNIRACVFWPSSDQGQPLYKWVKRRRWSLRNCLKTGSSEYTC